jgi:hypothetical protein
VVSRERGWRGVGKKGGFREERGWFQGREVEREEGVVQQLKF